jgi:Holliday junction DNA helicase RuvA
VPSYTPQQVKAAVCGSGRAGKGPGQRMVQTLLSLPDRRSPTTRPTRWPSRSATRTTRRFDGGLGGRPMIALVTGEVAVRRGDHVSSPRRRRLPPRGLRRDAAPRPARGHAGDLHTHLIVRDDALLLYGFATEEERDLFLLLIGVQAVGPKMALAVLSGGSPRELLAAVAAGDTRACRPCRDRQAHRRADRGRAAREGRRRADEPDHVVPRRRPARARPRRPRRPRLLARGGDGLLDGAPGDTPEDLIAARAEGVAPVSIRTPGADRVDRIQPPHERPDDDAEAACARAGWTSSSARRR